MSKPAAAIQNQFLGVSNNKGRDEQSSGQQSRSRLFDHIACASKVTKRFAIGVLEPARGVVILGQPPSSAFVNRSASQFGLTQLSDPEEKR